MFAIYSAELVFMKMNKRWWSVFIPVYNLMELTDAVLKSDLLGLLLLVPVIGQILGLYVLYKLEKAFKKNGLLTTIIPFVMLPIIGFGSNGFEGHNYVDDERHAREKDYKRSKWFLIVLFIFTAAAIGMYIYNNFARIKDHQRSLSNTYYVSISKIMVKETKKKFEGGKYSCDSNITANEYIFYYPDANDQFNIPFSLYTDIISGYVLVSRESISDEYHYYVSITDGKRGIEEVNIDNIQNSSVSDFTKLDDSYRYGIRCVLK